MNTTMVWHWEEDLRLSFQWDLPGDKISVRQGGFMEPEFDVLQAPYARSDTFNRITKEFANRCSEYAAVVRELMASVQKIGGPGSNNLTWPDFQIQNKILFLKEHRD